MVTNDKGQTTCFIDGCKRLALSRCDSCWRRYCPFHVAKLHNSWRVHKLYICKRCYDNSTSHYQKQFPTKYPPFPEYTEEEKVIEENGEAQS